MVLCVSDRKSTVFGNERTFHEAINYFRVRLLFVSKFDLMVCFLFSNGVPLVLFRSVGEV